MTDRETIWNKGDFPNTPSKIVQKRSGVNFTFRFSLNRTSADFHNTLMLHIPKDTRPESSQNLLFLLLPIDINSNSGATHILQSHAVYVAAKHLIPISKTFPWNTGFIAHHSDLHQQIPQSDPLTWEATGAESDQKHHIPCGWESGENRYEAAVCGDHCCAPPRLFSDLSAMSTG